MDIFGIGFPELIVIAVIALAVAGPKRLARWAYQAGGWFRDIRDMWNESVSYIREEIEAAGNTAPRPASGRAKTRKLTSGIASQKFDKGSGESPTNKAESAGKSPYDAWLPR